MLSYNAFDAALTNSLIFLWYVDHLPPHPRLCLIDNQYPVKNAKASGGESLREDAKIMVDVALFAFKKFLWSIFP